MYYLSKDWNHESSLAKAVAECVPHRFASPGVNAHCHYFSCAAKPSARLRYGSGLITSLSSLQARFPCNGFVLARRASYNTCLA